MSRAILFAALLALAGGSAAEAQSSAARSPNIHGVWGLDPLAATFIFAHRFEFFEGGDEVLSIPTFTLALGLPLGVTAGTDFTTNSEVVAGNLAGNEFQIWLKRPFNAGPLDLAGLVAWNTAAESLDGAVDVRYAISRVRLFAEGRAFTDLFGTGESGFAATGGAAIRLSEYLALSGDVGQVLSEGDYDPAWSAGLTIEIPASPHTMSLLVTNSGATTLQGVSREKTLGSSDVRYGFTFQVPIGGRGRWGRIFDPPTGD